MIATQRDNRDLPAIHLFCTLRAFPFATAQHIDFAYARILALRMSYVGELGWELYIPTEFAPGAFAALLSEGQQFDLRLVGLHTVDSLRLEKGYRHWGSDITPDDTPFEAGLGFAVKLDKGDFIGRAALLHQRASALTRKLVIFTLEDPEPLLYHDEPIYRNGETDQQHYSRRLWTPVGLCAGDGVLGAIRGD